MIPKLKEHTENNTLKEVLDKSSQVNRTIGITFALFIFYIAVNVASTSDLMLFIPDSGFLIPLINIQLPILAFFIAVPFLVLIFHYNLLFNLQQHSKKLIQWHEQNNSGKEDTQLYPFLFNYAITGLKPILAQTLNIVIRIAIFMLPLALLLMILIRFADYQSWTMTTWHFIALLLDAALIITHTEQIMKIIKTGKDEIKVTYTFKDFFAFAKTKNKLLRIIKNITIFF